MTAREALQNGWLSGSMEIHAHPAVQERLERCTRFMAVSIVAPTWVDALEAARTVLKDGGDDERHAGESFDER